MTKISLGINDEIVNPYNEVIKNCLRFRLNFSSLVFNIKIDTKSPTVNVQNAI